MVAPVNKPRTHIIRFIVLLAVQVSLLNQVQFSGYVNPYLYVLFILLLPPRLNRFYLLLIGFGTGLALDVFMGSYGLHAAATTLMAFLRSYVIRLYAVRGEDEWEYLGLSTMGTVKFLSYTLILVFAHHLLLFFLEAFRFAEFFTVLARTLLSTVFTVVLIYLVLLIFNRRSE